MSARSTALILATLWLTAACQRGSAPGVQPEGRPRSGTTAALDAGAKLLQGKAPLAGFDLYLDGFHPMKDDPLHPMEAHHYCKELNEEFTQCVLFDGNTAEANLTGVEYIISARLFDALPQSEKADWHPHNFEILSGQLVAPGLPAAAEKAALRRKMNSYGKTWHFWRTNMFGRADDRLPFGAPQLAWSFNAEGEIPAPLLQSRDERLGVSTAGKRRERSDLVSLARPQWGVDALAGAFPQRRPIPGVVEARH